MFKTSLFILLLAPALPAASASAADSAFVKAALQSGTHEIAQAALQADSTDYRVRQFAGRMTTDHKVADQQLIALAGARGIDTSAAPSQPAITGTSPAPNGVAGAPAAGGKHLSPREYFREEITAHQKAVALFRHEASSGTDAQLRAFARSTLPVLEQHLQLAQRYLAQEPKTP